MEANHPSAPAPAETVIPSDALQIIDTAPLGALIRYTDGSPKPPAHFTKKLNGKVLGGPPLDTPQAPVLHREPRANVERYDGLRAQIAGGRQPGLSGCSCA